MRKRIKTPLSQIYDLMQRHVNAVIADRIIIAEPIRAGILIWNNTFKIGEVEANNVKIIYVKNKRQSKKT